MVDMEKKEQKQSEIPEELELKAGLLAKSLMKLPPRNQEDRQEKEEKV